MAFDGFIDNANKWDTGLKNGSNSNEEVYASFISISDGVYVWDVTEVKLSHVIASQTIPDEKSVEDFLLSVDAINVSNNPDLCYGLIFRANGLSSYWFTVCNSQRYRIFVTGISGEEATFRNLSDWNDSSVIKPDDWNQLKVIASGSQFEFYINDVQVEQIRDTALTSGTFGIVFEADKGESGQIWFDNFQYEIR